MNVYGHYCGISTSDFDIMITPQVGDNSSYRSEHFGGLMSQVCCAVCGFC